MTDEIENTKDELETLKERADKLGISYHPNISLAKLKSKVNAAVEEDVPTKEAPVELSKKQRRMQLVKEQTAQIRIRVTCMDQNKKAWQGTLITASNSASGTHKKYIPFDVAWHVPKIIYNVLKNKKHLVFYTEKINGNQVTRSKQVNTYAIEVLPPLTPKELKELAQRQAMAEGTGE